VTLNDLEWPFCVKFCFAPVWLEFWSLTFEAWLLLNLQWTLSANFKRKRTAAASRGFLATYGLSCFSNAICCVHLLMCNFLRLVGSSSCCYEKSKDIKSVLNNRSLLCDLSSNGCKYIRFPYRQQLYGTHCSYYLSPSATLPAANAGSTTKLVIIIVLAAAVKPPLLLVLHDVDMTARRMQCRAFQLWNKLTHSLKSVKELGNS